MLTILFYTFVGVTVIQFLYYSFIFSKFSWHKPIKGTKKDIGVSVLVCAKNEADNLKELIPLLVKQKYALFEIVLINDASTDSTLDIMQGFQEQYDYIKIVDVKPTEAFLSSKKYALTLGIKASKFDFLLFTDADCKPISKYWIAQMSSHFTNTKTIVLGYGAYKKIKNSFVNLLVRFETLLTAIHYFSYAKLGKPYMAVGRNLAYRKDEFFNVNGFTNHMQVLSGDDDLFINQVANAKNTAICFTKSSFTESIPVNTLRSWFKQKKRHISTSRYYKPEHKILLGLFYLSQLLFWTLLGVLLIYKFNWLMVLVLAIIRFLIVSLIYVPASKKLNETDLILFLPFLELFLIVSQLVIFISGLMYKSRHWN